MSRIETYERIYLGENLEMPKAVSRIDKLWEAVINGTALPFKPSLRGEFYLAHMIDESIKLPKPVTVLEKIMYAVATNGKVDKSIKKAFNDKYLKYIYEQASGENMFVPNNPATASGVSFNGKTITLNGTLHMGWSAQQYKSIPLLEGDIVTLRYKYKSGEVKSSATDSVIRIVPYTTTGKAWATENQLVVKKTDYSQDIVLVTTITQAPNVFNIFVDSGASAEFDNLKFEVSFEKGDTTK